MAVIVTGANSGIGYEVAKSLCRQGHDVVISVRDEEKGDSTVSRIKSEFPDAQLTYFTMEMSDPQSIRSFVENFKATGKSLHILINNAGVLHSWSESERHCVRGDESLEETMMVNCIGPFLLTNLLLHKLKESANKESPSRIVNVSSNAINFKPIEWPVNLDDIMLENTDSYICGAQAYRHSKVGMNLWSKELASRLNGTNVTVNCLCPGFVPDTAIFRNTSISFFSSPFMWFAHSFIGRAMIKAKTVTESGDVVLDLATRDKYKSSNGVFYNRYTVQDEPQDVVDASNQAKLWEICSKYSGLA